MQTVIRLAATPWWWGYTETVSPCPPRLHRISTGLRLRLIVDFAKTY